MGTEQASARYLRMDTWGDAEILEAILESQLAAVAALRPALPALARAAAAIADRLGNGGRIFYVGAGASGRLAVQEGTELPSTFGWPEDRLGFLFAGGESALVHPSDGAEDDEAEARHEVERLGLTSSDVVLCLAASGRTPYTVAAQALARSRGALTIGIANNPDTPLLTGADHPILLDTGSEVVAGATRMKAGTAQKVALNMLSTLAMVRLGRVFDGYMIGVQPGNRKLVQRQETILMELTGRSAADVRAALLSSGGDLKRAVLVLGGASPDSAEAALKNTGGDLRKALARVG